MKDSVFRLRLPSRTREAWDAAAAERGVSVAELVRDAVNVYLGQPAVVLASDVAAAVPVATVKSQPLRSARKRLGQCGHGVHSWDHCEKCD